MKLMVEIDCDGRAFFAQDGEPVRGVECARILRELAKTVMFADDPKGGWSQPARDYDGNVCARATFVASDPPGIRYIYSPSEDGFWNNEDGWGSLATASEVGADDLADAERFVAANPGSRIVTAAEAKTLVGERIDSAELDHRMRMVHDLRKRIVYARSGGVWYWHDHDEPTNPHGPYPSFLATVADILEPYHAAEAE